MFETSNSPEQEPNEDQPAGPDQFEGGPLRPLGGGEITAQEPDDDVVYPPYGVGNDAPGKHEEGRGLADLPGGAPPERSDDSAPPRDTTDKPPENHLAFLTGAAQRDSPIP